MITFTCIHLAKAFIQMYPIYPNVSVYQILMKCVVFINIRLENLEMLLSRNY